MESDLLRGQIVVVTGGSRGIGREIAQALAKDGAKVAVTGRNREQLDETVKLVKEQGGQCFAFVMDVTDSDEIKKVMIEIDADLGPVDLLVNNAGVGGGGMLPWEVDADDWWRTMEVNLRGPFLCSHAILPSMVERQKGRIINLSSNAGLHPIAMASAYSVSKSALIHLTRCLAEAAKEFNVSVFAISPGLVLTDMTRDVPIFKDLPDSEWTPVERVGELCVFLASGEADQLTGRYIHVREDDIHDLVERAEEIVENNLNVMQFHR